MDDRFKIEKPDFEARIYYLTTEEGGRDNSIMNGYRGQFHYDDNDYDAPQEFIGRDSCNLGETIDVKMKVVTPKLHKNSFFEGKNFEIREGVKVVGKGVITKIFNEDLIASNI